MVGQAKYMNMYDMFSVFVCSFLMLYLMLYNFIHTQVVHGGLSQYKVGDLELVRINFCSR